MSYKFPAIRKETTAQGPHRRLPWFVTHSVCFLPFLHEILRFKRPILHVGAKNGMQMRKIDLPEETQRKCGWLSSKLKRRLVGQHGLVELSLRQAFKVVTCIEPSRRRDEHDWGGSGLAGMRG